MSHVIMNMKYSYPTTMYESILAQMYVFLVFLYFTAFNHEKDFKQQLQKIFFYQNCVHSGENTFIHCSQIVVVHIHVIIFSRKLTQPVRVTQTESN